MIPLPLDGSPIVAALAVERSGLAPSVAWPKLAAMCAAGEAKAWSHEGVTWAKRVGVVALTAPRLQGTRTENAQGGRHKMANARPCQAERSRRTHP